MRGVSRNAPPPLRTADPSALDLDILVIDDEKSIRKTVRVCIEALGCRVYEASNAPATRAALEERTYDLVLLDVRLGKENGLELLPSLLARSANMEVVVMTAFASIDTAVEAMRRGAYDYLAKPFTPAQLQELVERVAARRAIDHRIRDLRVRREHTWPDLTLHTEAPKMLQALELVARAAAESSPILLRGEPGTGKLPLARRLHALGARCSAPFVVAHCRGAGEEELQAALFGRGERRHDGEPTERRGLVEAAGDGTLYIDEIGALPVTLQTKVLRLIDEKRFEPCGSFDSRAASVRVVAATELDLAHETQAGRFRPDLLDRFLALAVPPLRERREDILPLARRALAFFGRGAGAPQPDLTLEAETALLAYEWPGNIRELCQAMEHASALRVGMRIAPDALPDRIAAREGTSPYLGGEFTVEAIEREHILRVLAHAKSQEDASRILGIDASTLWRKRKRYESTS